MKTDSNMVFMENKLVWWNYSLRQYKNKFYVLLGFSGKLRIDDKSLNSTNDKIQAIAVFDEFGKILSLDYANDMGWKAYDMNLDSTGNIYLSAITTISTRMVNCNYFSGRVSDSTIFLLIKIGKLPSADIYSFTKLKDNTNLVFTSDSHTDSTNIILTSAQQHRVGYVWIKDKVPVVNGFSLTFSFRMNKGKNDIDDGSLPGADGLSFIIQNNNVQSFGNSGGGIGYSGIPNSFAIEYDTYWNQFPADSYNDPNGNHIGVFCSGALPNTSDHKSQFCLGTNNTIITLRSDGTIYYSKIDYNAEENKLNIYLDSTKNFNSSFMEISNVDLSKLLNLSEGKAFVGFSAATGTSTETHEILSWNFCSNYKPITSIQNDDFKIQDGEYLYCSPNPATDFIEISYPGIDRMVNHKVNEANHALNSVVNSEIAIYNVFGEKIPPRLTSSSTPQEGNLRLDVSGLPPGMYFLRVGEKIGKFLKI